MRAVARVAFITAAGLVAGMLHAAPRLEVPVTLHDFGKVPQGEIARHNFKIKNIGDEPLEITEVKPACGCTTAGEWTRTIAPGETGTIPIQFDTGHFSGAVSKTIAVVTNDPEHRQTTLEIKAAIWTPVQVETPVLIFPALSNPNEVSTRSTKIRTQVEGAVTLSDLTNDSPLFKAELKESVPGREYDLNVTTVAPLPEGTHVAHLTMKSSNPKMPHVTAQAVVTVLPPVQVAPTEVMFATEKLAASEKRYVVVLNHRGADLKVSDVKTNVPGVESAMNTTPDGRQTTIALTFPAGFEIHPGQKFLVSGKTNHPTLPSFQVPIVYSGNR
jgi:hypothetical protein